MLQVGIRAAARSSRAAFKPGLPLQDAPSNCEPAEARLTRHSGPAGRPGCAGGPSGVAVRAEPGAELVS